MQAQLLTRQIKPRIIPLTELLTEVGAELTVQNSALNRDRLGRTAPMSEGLIGSNDDYLPTQVGFGRPFIDVDEQKDEPYPHWLLHCGFEGAETLFSFYLPTYEQYDGRVLQFLEGGSGGHENIMASGFMAFGNDAWQFDYAFNDMGAVLIESNQGHPASPGHTGCHNDKHLFGASVIWSRSSGRLSQSNESEESHKRQEPRHGE
jgi:hypothetical protein